MSEEDKISVDLIADIFNIPTNGANINDDEDDIEVGQAASSVPFSEKAKDIVSEISTIESTPVADKVVKAATVEVKAEVKPEPKVPKVEDVLTKTAPAPASADVFKKTVLDEVKPKTRAKKAEKVEETAPVKDLFEAVEEKPAEKPVTVTMKVEVADTVQTKNAIQDAIEKAAQDYEEEEEEKERNAPVRTHECDQWAEGEDWILNSPAPKYDGFYREKASLLTDGPRGILIGGKVNFDELFDELSTLNCDMTVTTYDPQAIYEKMVSVQQMRERVREIQLKVSRQFFLWERYIELFQGVLARTEYVRGKQEGIIYEHMRDMEHYFCSLKALQRGSETIFKTLDAAFDVLSRQVTIVMPMKDVERVTPNSNISVQQQRPMTSQQKKYDSLGPKPDNKPSDGLSSKGSGWNAV